MLVKFEEYMAKAYEEASHEYTGRNNYTEDYALTHAWMEKNSAEEALSAMVIRVSCQKKCEEAKKIPKEVTKKYEDAGEFYENVRQHLYASI